MVGTRTDPSPILKTTLPLKRDLQDHPIAPTEFPKTWSTTEVARGPVGRWGPCDIHTSGGGRPGPVTSNEVDGYRTRLTPRNLVKSLAQRPTIHRPQPP